MPRAFCRGDEKSAGGKHRRFRAVRRRSQRREEPLPNEVDATQADNPLDRIQADEFQRILHEEIQRLPRRYREVVVLCDLQANSRVQAADRLDATEQSVKAALARARRLLRMQLVRRGIAMSVAVALARNALAASMPSSALIDKTVQLGTTNHSGWSFKSSQSPITMESSFAMIFSTHARIVGILISATLILTVSVVLVAQRNGSFRDRNEPVVVAMIGDDPQPNESAGQTKLVRVGDTEDAESETANDQDGDEGMEASSLEHAAKRAYEAAAAQLSFGAIQIEDLYQWSKRWMDASANPMSARKKHLQRMKELHSRVAAMYRAGGPNASSKDYYATAYYVAEAERLTRAP